MNYDSTVILLIENFEEFQQEIKLDSSIKANSIIEGPDPL
jgi:hypothetical protein